MALSQLSARQAQPVAAPRCSLRARAAASRARLPAPRSTVASAEGSGSTAVTHVDTEAAYDALVSGTSDKLVIVECSATWCGPCKLFAPAYESFAEAYGAQAVFVSVMGDANKETAALMKRLEVKSVPAFFIFKQGTKVASWTGANKQGFRNQMVAAGMTL